MAIPTHPEEILQASKRLSDRERFLKKYVNDYASLAQAIQVLRDIHGYRIVVTIGSWDMLHIGHVRYLLEARKFGDILVVGTDSDRAVKIYKGPGRPITPENERIEMVCYQAPTDYVTLIDDVDEKGKWTYRLLKLLRPDVFVAVEDSYPPEQIEDIKQLCGSVVTLPRQAEATSTTNVIENIKKAKNIEKRSVPSSNASVA